MAIQVGVRELKNNLSRYLDQVKQGKTIQITERGKLIGQIIPGELTMQERLRVMVQSGLAEWDGKTFTPRQPVAVNHGERLISDLVIEERESHDLY